MTKIQNSKIRKSKAFTLVEILTVVFLGSLIIMAAYSVYLMSYKSYKKQSEMAELTQNARIALERMPREIRQTNEILTTLPEAPGTPIPSTQIKFQDGHTTDQIQYISYYILGTDLYREVGHYYFSSDPNVWVEATTLENNQPPSWTIHNPPGNEIKAQKITALQFSVDSVDAVVTIDLTVSDGKSTYQFETKTTPRNI